MSYFFFGEFEFDANNNKKSQLIYFDWGKRNPQEKVDFEWRENDVRPLFDLTKIDFKVTWRLPSTPKKRPFFFEILEEKIIICFRYGAPREPTNDG